MFYKLKLSSLSLLFAALLFTGCNDNNNLEPEPDKPELNEQEWPDGQNVYVAGFENVQTNPVARLWKNGTVQNLTGSSEAAFRSSTILSSEARSVFVSGNDVYVAGYDIILSEGERIGRARLWKNGEVQQLDNGTYFDQALSVFVSGDDVYVLGSESLHPVPSSTGGWVYKYWKNGKAEIFAKGNNGEGVNSIFVSNNDIYIAGGYENQAKLWKNGEEENLAGGNYANSVFVLNNDVYVAGYGSTIAKLWKNGKLENITNGINNAHAFSVYVSDNNVYVAGHDGDEARLWKNGVVQKIADDKDARMFLSVFIANKDVYTTGYVEVIEPIQGSPLSYGYLKASLWKNDKKLILNTEGKNSNSKALSVFVK